MSLRVATLDPRKPIRNQRIGRTIRHVLSRRSAPDAGSKSDCRVAPPYTYTLIARVIGPSAPPIGVEFMMEQTAAGRLLPRTVQTNPAQPTIVQTNTDIISNRDIVGTLFIKVD
ncbi:MAG: hypothetical protein ACJAUW_001830 [Yoonia sp.]